MTTPFNPMKAVFDETNRIFAEAAPKDPPTQPQVLNAYYLETTIDVLNQLHKSLCEYQVTDRLDTRSFMEANFAARMTRDLRDQLRTVKHLCKEESAQ